MTSVAISQSNYWPWRGYFKTIDSVDVFVLYDEVQYTRRDWRNRNRILGPSGPEWLTVPVKVRGRFHQRIDETTVADQGWRQAHWSRLSQVYGATPGMSLHGETMSRYFEAAVAENLSHINRLGIETACEIFDVTTELRWSTDFERRVDGRNERLIEICQQVGATTYVSGPAAQEYLDVEAFERAGIDVEWADYDGLPDYEQPGDEFVPTLSILDAIFGGGGAPELIRA